jgi:hypothetical protein
MRKAIYWALLGFLIALASFSYAESCSDIKLGTSTITVEKGRSATKNFALSNNASERFFVDYVSVFDESQNFRAESNGFDREVKAGGIGAIGVKVNAYSSAGAVKEKAFISIKGHFASGGICNLGETEKEFLVKVVEAETNNYQFEASEERSENETGPAYEGYSTPSLPYYSDYCNGFVIRVPSTKTIQQSSTIALEIENNTPHRATVRLSGENIGVEPSLLSVPSGFKSKDYKISVFAPESGTLYYEIETFNCMARKSTAILRQETTQTAEQTGLPVEQGTSVKSPEEPQKEGQEAKKGTLQAIAGTALAVLGQNSAALGLLALAIAVLAYAGVRARKGKQQGNAPPSSN